MLECEKIYKYFVHDFNYGIELIIVLFRTLVYWLMLDTKIFMLRCSVGKMTISGTFLTPFSNKFFYQHQISDKMTHNMTVLTKVDFSRTIAHGSWVIIKSKWKPINYEPEGPSYLITIWDTYDALAVFKGKPNPQKCTHWYTLYVYYIRLIKLIYIIDDLIWFVVKSDHLLKRSQKKMVLSFFIIKNCKSWQLKCISC